MHIGCTMYDYIHTIPLTRTDRSMLLDALAQTSLYVPGFDPQPLSAKQVGVADGRTTWELVAGQPTGTFDNSDFPGTGSCLLST